MWFVWKIWDFLVAQRQKLGARGHRALLEHSPETGHPLAGLILIFWQAPTSLSYVNSPFPPTRPLEAMWIKQYLFMSYQSANLLKLRNNHKNSVLITATYNLCVDPI